jgi:hypothetical protein
MKGQIRVMPGKGVGNAGIITNEVPAQAIISMMLVRNFEVNLPLGISSALFVPAIANSRGG